MTAVGLRSTIVMHAERLKMTNTETEKQYKRWLAYVSVLQKHCFVVGFKRLVETVFQIASERIFTIDQRLECSFHSAVISILCNNCVINRYDQIWTNITRSLYQLFSRTTGGVVSLASQTKILKKSFFRSTCKSFFLIFRFDCVKHHNFDFVFVCHNVLL